MQDLLFAFLDMNCVTPFDHRDFMLEVQELVNEFNLTMGTNLDPVQYSREYIAHAYKYSS